MDNGIGKEEKMEQKIAFGLWVEPETANIFVHDDFGNLVQIRDYVTLVYSTL